MPSPGSSSSRTEIVPEIRKSALLITKVPDTEDDTKRNNTSARYKPYDSAAVKHSMKRQTELRRKGILELQEKDIDKQRKMQDSNDKQGIKITLQDKVDNVGAKKALVLESNIIQLQSKHNPSSANGLSNVHQNPSEKANPKTAKTLFKSKFWEYVEPIKKTSVPISTTKKISSLKVKSTEPVPLSISKRTTNPTNNSMEEDMKIRIQELTDYQGIKKSRKELPSAVSDLNGNAILDKPQTENPTSTLLEVVKDQVGTSVSKKNENLPENEVEKPKVLYKSKFWDYIDPNKKDATTKKNCDRQKPYDPNAVKGFIEKQKELRKLKELSELQQREKQMENKKKQLQDLNDKSKKLRMKSTSSKGKHFSGHITPFLKPREIQTAFVAQQLEKRERSKTDTSFKLDSPLPSKPSIKILEDVPIQAHQRANLLLKEFEALVIRECKNFFATSEQATALSETPSTIPITNAINVTTKPVKVDKAIETTLSLEEPDKDLDSSFSSLSTVKSIARYKADFDWAASKIQAAYKGYKVRKILKEARVLPRTYQAPINENESFRIRIEDLKKRRRMSFYRSPSPQSPEKRNESRTKTKLKAVPISPKVSSTVLKNDLQFNSYIPPSLPGYIGSRKSPHSHPQMLSPMKLARVINEPYPKEAIQRLYEINGSPSSGSERPYQQDILRKMRCKDESPGVQRPSITDVLFEKLRLLAAEEERKNILRQNTLTSEADHIQKGIIYESDFESVSSITRHSEVENNNISSGNVTITDDYFGPSETEARNRTSTPKFVDPNIPTRKRLSRKSRSKSKSRSPRQENSSMDSNTTVETDADLLPTTDSKPTKTVNMTKTELSTTDLVSSVSTPSIHLQNLPIPALKLRYHAERERLNILEKALQVIIQHDQTRSPQKLGRAEIVQIAKTAVDQHIKAKFAKFETETEPSETMPQLATAVEQNRECPSLIPQKMEEERFEPEVETGSLIERLETKENSIENVLLAQQTNLEDSSTLHYEVKYSEPHPLEVDITHARHAEIQFKILEKSDIELSETIVQHAPLVEENTDPSLIPNNKVQELLFEPEVETCSLIDLLKTKDENSRESSLENVLASQANLEDSSTLNYEVKHSEPLPLCAEIPSKVLEKPDIELSKSDIELLKTVQHVPGVEVEQNKDNSDPSLVPNKIHELSGLDVETDSLIEVLETKDDSIENVLVSQANLDETCETSILETESKYSESLPLEVDIITHSPDTEIPSDSEVLEKSDIELSEAIIQHASVVEENTDNSDPSLIQNKVQEPFGLEVETVSLIEQLKTKEIFLENVSALQTNLDDSSTLKTELKYSEPLIPLEVDITHSYDTEIPSDAEVLEKSDIELSETKSDIELSERIEEHAPDLTLQTKVQYSKPLPLEVNIAHSLDTEIPFDSEVLEKLDIELSETKSDIELSERIEEHAPDLTLKTKVQYSEPLPLEVNITHNLLEEIPPEGIEITEIELTQTIVQHSPVMEENKENTDPSLIPNKIQELSEIEVETGSLIEMLETKDDNSLENVLVSQENLQETLIFQTELKYSESISTELVNNLHAEGLPSEEGQPPPPSYSPPSSESLSYSFRSFFINLETETLKNAIESYVEQIWDEWNSNKILLSVKFDKMLSSKPTDSLDESGEKFKDDSAATAEWVHSSFNNLVSDVVEEVTQNILKVETGPSVNFVDSVRRGPIATQAQKFRFPKSKEALTIRVYNATMKIIPKLTLSDGLNEIVKKAPSKWTCRPRDLVEEILIEEMIEEEPLWTEIWPEELLVKDDLCYKILRDSVRNVISNFETALALGV